MSNLTTIPDDCAPGIAKPDLYARMNETARKMAEADSKIVKLIIFHSQEDVVHSLRNVPMPSSSVSRDGILEWTGPEIMIDPLINTEPGMMWPISDPMVLMVVKAVHRRNQEESPAAQPTDATQGEDSPLE